MFKYVSIFVCLLGVSLASEVSGLKGHRSSQVVSLLEAVKKHQDYLDVCEDILGENIKSCGALLDDLYQLKTDILSAISEGWSVYEDGVTLMTEFTSCSTMSIWKEVACYKKVLTAAKALVATAEEDAEDAETTIAADITQLESDLSSCATSGYTSHLLNSKIALCKLRLMLKN